MNPFGRPQKYVESDMLGKRYGRLVVIRKAPPSPKFRGASWECLCDCGNRAIVETAHMGKTRSCGCLRHEKLMKRNTTHGLSHTPEYQMLKGAKSRAKRGGMEFDLDISDIVIPERCPALGIPIISGIGTGCVTPNSATVDRVDNSRGYTKGNVVVISHRANSLKRDGTSSELRAIADWMDSHSAATA